MVAGAPISTALEAGRVVVVHGPAAVGHEVVEAAAGLDVVLGEDVVADVAAALALGGQELDPVQGPVGCFLLVRAAVLDVVPHAEGDLAAARRAGARCRGCCRARRPVRPTSSPSATSDGRSPP